MSFPKVLKGFIIYSKWVVPERTPYINQINFSHIFQPPKQGGSLPDLPVINGSSL